MIGQREKHFFDITPNRSRPHLPLMPSQEELLSLVNSSQFPLNKELIISPKNEGAVLNIRLKILQALSRYNHSMGCFGTKGNYSTNSMALVGESSTGKTHLSKLIAKCVELPFIEIHPSAVSNTNDIFKLIKKEFDKTATPLVDLEDGFYRLPPCIIFIDEAHELRGQLKGGEGLLQATEPSDAMMQTIDGIKVDCFNACWIVATTELGKLFHAFKTRMDVIQLEPPTKQDIAKILKMTNPDIDFNICQLVAKYSNNPREAKRFMSSLITYRQFHDYEWEVCAKEIARSKGIDEDGLHYMEVRLLELLKKGPVGKKNLPFMLNCQTEQLENDILPPLMRYVDDRPPLVHMTRKGVTITDAGKFELSKRG